MYFLSEKHGKSFRLENSFSDRKVGDQTTGASRREERSILPGVSNEIQKHEHFLKLINVLK